MESHVYQSRKGEKKPCLIYGCLWILIIIYFQRTGYSYKVTPVRCFPARKREDNVNVLAIIFLFKAFSDCIL